MKTVRSKLAIPVACLIVLTIAFLSGCGGTEPGTKLKDPTREPVEAASEGQLLTIDDVLDIDAVSEFRISPDGSSIAWVVDGQELFLVDIEAGGSRQVDLPGGVTVAQPRWSPDSKRLAFISDAPAAGAGEPGLPQVWVLDVTGEGLSSITEAPSGVIALSWAGLDTILYTSPDGGPEQRPGDNTIRVSDYSDTPTRLFSVNLETQAVEKLTDNDDRITSISASPDGKHAFYTRTMCVNDIYLWQWQQKIPFDNYLFDLETREEKQVFAESRWIVGGGGQWSPDSDRLYVIDNYDTDEILANYLSIVRSIDIESGAEEKINLDWGRGVDQMHSLHYGCLAPTDEGFLALLADGPNPRLANYTRPGSNWERSMLEGQHQGNIFSFDASADGRTICYNYSTSNDPQQLYVARLNGSAIEDAELLTDLNPDLAGKNLGRAEVISWIGARGDEISGTLHYPPGYQPDRKYPLVLSIHGGPPESVPDQFMESWNWPVRFTAQRGALVLTADYHGSLNYGLEFQKSLLGGNYYDLPIEDFEKGIDRLHELGMVDTDLLGTMGWSNGGILSNAIIARDQRFKAASCGAGGAEWVSDWAIAYFGAALMGDYWLENPLEHPEYYIDPDISPFYDAEKVKTPVIMFHGTDDRNVATSMSWTTFRGIQNYGETPTELFLFPGEPHMLQSRAHQHRKMEEEREWFDRYLFGNGK